MLRITANTSPDAAAKYYNEGLSKQDYYSEKGEIIGNWNGKAAEKLGLQNEVTKEEFTKLCYNINPENDKQLTARNSDNRRVGYDFTFSVPKSVSIVHSITQDKEILNAFRESVAETMQEIEKGVQTRVRKNGQDFDRTTGNLVYGEFIHTTSRPVDGVPDCHLHAHCFTFNATFDEHENAWKAAQFGQIKSDGAYYEAYFNSLLADKLQKVGYDLERNKTNFEIKGISRETIDKFSNRTVEIEELAKEKNMTNPKFLDGLGAKTRENKRTGLSTEQLHEVWKNRLSQDETTAVWGAKNNWLKENESSIFNQVKSFAVENKKEITPEQAIDYSLANSLERKSTVTEKKLLTDAMKYGYTSFTPNQLLETYNNRKDLIFGNKEGNKVVTIKEAIQEENQLIKNCIDSKGKFKPLNDNYFYKDEKLNFEQRKAITHALTSTDGVISIEGGAGTGKTTLMSEVKNGIFENGKKIFAFAPSSEASRGVLRKEGFDEADTVAALLTNKKLHEQLKGQVIWVDEAGMVDNKSMNGIFEIAKNNNARLVLTGDTKQHASVARGDAFRIIQEKGGIPTIRVNEVVRQKNYKEYKQAMELISNGDTNKAFGKLENMGAIKQISDQEKRHKEIANEYLQGVTERKGNGFKEVLVVAPTHKEGELVTDKIRETLRNASRIKKEEYEFTKLKNKNFTEAERKDIVNYQTGQIIEFHQNIPGFKAGDKYMVSGKDEQGKILVKSGEKTQPLPFEQAKNFQVFTTEPIKFSEGDKIKITRNGKSIEGTKLNNGQIYNVNGFDAEGNIQLSNGSTLKKDFAHVNHGYAVTSDASQGKTVDKVIVAQSSLSFGASTKEQFYVSVSRGKESVSVYTDNKAELKEIVTNRSAERMTALELEKQSLANRVREQQFTVNRLLAISRTYASQLTNKISETMQRYKAPNNQFTSNKKPVNINEQLKTTPPRGK